MSNLIHDFPLNTITGFNFSHKDVRIDGYETKKAQLDALTELFARATSNVLHRDRPGGPSHIMDLTADQRNFRFCSFTTIELMSGWYALKSISYSPKKGRINYYPYRITLFYIGTAAGYQTWYEVQDLEGISNDWGI